MKKRAAFIVAETLRSFKSLDSQDTKEYDILLPFAFVFTPKVKNGEVVPLKKRSKTMAKILGKHEELKSANYEVDFLIAYDMDENGELMANILHNSLVEYDVDPQNIIRMPYCEHGFVVFSEFQDISDYIKFKSLQHDFMAKLQEKGLPKMGLRKAYSFDFVKSFKKRKGNKIDLKRARVVNPEGTSTITYVTRALLEWKDEEYENE